MNSGPFSGRIVDGMMQVIEGFGQKIPFLVCTVQIISCRRAGGGTEREAFVVGPRG